MYTCPDNNVHLLYSDGELHPDRQAAYEAHLKTCEACRKKLSGLRAVRCTLFHDAAQIGLRGADLDISYQRLQARLRYHGIIKNAGTRTFPSGLRRAAPALAAVFALAFFMPLLWLQNIRVVQSDNPPAVIAPVELYRQPSKLFQDIMVTGNIDWKTLPVLAADAHEDSADKTYLGERRLFSLPEIDVFRPDFTDMEIRLLDIANQPIQVPVGDVYLQSIPVDFQLP
jgi:hypothetical protein